MKKELHNTNVGAASAPRPANPHSRNLRLHRRTAGEMTVFVTKRIQPCQPVFGPGQRTIVASALPFAVEHKRIVWAAYDVMPEQWHALPGLVNDSTLPDIMHSIMSFVGGKTCRVLNAHGCRRQDGCHKTWIRSARQFASSLRELDLLTNPWPWEFEENGSGH